MATVPPASGPLAGENVKQFTVSENARVVDCAPESVACTVKGKVPFWVGVPASIPDGASVRPAGSDPAEIENVMGATPPVCVNVLLYAAPAVAVPSATLFTTSQSTLSVRDRGALEQPFASVATTENRNDPPEVGVPEMRPEADSVRPGGNDPVVMANTQGFLPPATASAFEYAVPRRPRARVVVVTVIVEQFTASV